MTTQCLLRWVMSALLCALALTSVNAEELSLTQAVEIAIKNNPTIAAQSLDAEAAQHAARGARALTNPEISVAPTLIGEAGADAALLFSQPLEINGARSVRGRIASHEARAAEFAASATRRDVLRDVKQAYWDVSRAQESVRLNQENVEFVQTLRTAVGKQLDAGAVPGSQAVKTDVELARARQEVAQAELEMSTAKAALNALLNRTDNQGFTVAGPPSEGIADLNREQLQTTAQKRPEVASAQAELAAASGRVRAAGLLRVPDLAVQARRDVFGSNAESGMAVAVSLPLLDWGSARAEKKRTQTAVRAQQQRAEAIKTQVALEVDQALQQALTASRIIQEYQGGILEKSEQLATMARTGYEKGATGYLEVLEAQRTLRQVRNAYYTALADRAKAQAQLEWATGAEPGREVKK